MCGKPRAMLATGNSGIPACIFGTATGSIFYDRNERNASITARDITVTYGTVPLWGIGRKREIAFSVTAAALKENAVFFRSKRFRCL